MLKHVAATRTILSCQHTVNELWNILKMTNPIRSTFYLFADDVTEYVS